MKSEKDAILLRQKYSNIANKLPHKDEQGHKHNEGPVAFKLTSKTIRFYLFCFPLEQNGVIAIGLHLLQRLSPKQLQLF